MGYQLPDDVDAVSGLRWYLVAVPDDDAYGVAALGAYTELADVWKWGKEGITADSYTARQQWLSAIDETLEALEMGFPTTLLGYIDEVETLLEAIRDAQQIAQPCCDSTLFNPAPAAIDEAIDSVPQVIQDNYTTGDDWGEVWESYMCPLLREAWERIDDHVLEPWEYYINLGGGGVAVLTTLYVAWAGIGAAVVVAGFTIADVLALFAAVKGYIGDAVMGDYSDWDTHADDFICAVRDADGPEAKQAAAEDFIDSLSYSVPVKLLARFAFHSGFWQQVYTGIGADGNEIIVSGDGCPTCAGGNLDVLYTYDADAEAWTLASRFAWDVTQVLISNPRSTAGNGMAYKWRAELFADGGFTGDHSAATIYLDSITLDLLNNSGDPLAAGKTARIDVWYTDGTNDALQLTTYGSNTVYPNPAKEIAKITNAAVQLRTLHNGLDSSQIFGFDNVRILGRVTQP